MVRAKNGGRPSVESKRVKERELQRKDKALAVASAILVLNTPDRSGRVTDTDADCRGGECGRATLDGERASHP